MSRQRYQVQRLPAADFTAGDGATVRVYGVTDLRAPQWDRLPVHVWYAQERTGRPARPRCVSCSGLLSAMLSTCRHADAVRRHTAKEAP
jgi:hypothetical protein